MRLHRPLHALLAAGAVLAGSLGLLATPAEAATPLPQHVFAPYFEAWTGRVRPRWPPSPGPRT